MVHAPERSFGSLLAGASGCISGFNALMSSSSDSGAGAAAAAFFPKILESNVAIVQFPFQSCAMRTGNAHPDRFTLHHIPVHMDFVIRSRPAEVVLLDQNFLSGAYKPRALRQRNSIDQFETSLVPLFNHFLRKAIEPGRGCSFTSGVLEDKPPVELEFFNHR